MLSAGALLWMFGGLMIGAVWFATPFIVKFLMGVWVLSKRFCDMVPDIVEGSGDRAILELEKQLSQMAPGALGVAGTAALMTVATKGAATGAAVVAMKGLTGGSGDALGGAASAATGSNVVGAVAGGATSALLRAGYDRYIGPALGGRFSSSAGFVPSTGNNDQGDVEKIVTVQHLKDPRESIGGVYGENVAAAKLATDGNNTSGSATTSAVSAGIQSPGSSNIQSLAQNSGYSLSTLPGMESLKAQADEAAKLGGRDRLRTVDEELGLLNGKDPLSLSSDERKRREELYSEKETLEVGLAADENLQEKMNLFGAILGPIITQAMIAAMNSGAMRQQPPVQKTEINIDKLIASIEGLAARIGAVPLDASPGTASGGLGGGGRGGRGGNGNLSNEPSGDDGEKKPNNANDNGNGGNGSGNNGKDQKHLSNGAVNDSGYVASKKEPSEDEKALAEMDAPLSKESLAKRKEEEWIKGFQKQFDKEDAVLKKEEEVRRKEEEKQDLETANFVAQGAAKENEEKEKKGALSKFRPKFVSNAMEKMEENKEEGRANIKAAFGVDLQEKQDKAKESLGKATSSFMNYEATGYESFDQGINKGLEGFGGKLNKTLLMMTDAQYKANVELINTLQDVKSKREKGELTHAEFVTAFEQAMLKQNPVSGQLKSDRKGSGYDDDRKPAAADVRDRVESQKRATVQDRVLAASEALDQDLAPAEGISQSQAKPEETTASSRTYSPAEAARAPVVIRSRSPVEPQVTTIEVEARVVSSEVKGNFEAKDDD